jgi:hypothetical protein
MRSNKRIGVSDDAFNIFSSGTNAGENVPRGMFMDIGPTALMKCVPNGRPTVPSGADQHRKGRHGE